MRTQNFSIVGKKTDSTQQLIRTIRHLRISMQKCIDSENWQDLARLDRLCVRALDSATPLNLTRELAVEVLRVRELYRYLVKHIGVRSGQVSNAS